ncbi:unnamed protein product [Cylicocyclus nassatus]|uniref:Uncharacterized protein n=1 Tax=Cylicocyclus nassatus TaxID=53992 RepID=A0AA36GKT4_CYLNA|nr:unnamed protein product [Cylicocyclus nassatus]CAJ0593939.1 unnamed protein product [Cylicocyclus nassatus]
MLCFRIPQAKARLLGLQVHLLLQSKTACADRYAVVRKVWQDILDAFPHMPDFSLEEVREIMDEFHQEGYCKRRRTILKSVQMHDRPTASLDDVPENLRTLRDGTTFLQFSSPGLYIYYSKTTIQKAVENGLTALVADGIHKLPPKALGDDGQLHCPWSV